MLPIVTLTTDFGLHDSFVGAMKGVLLSRCPGAQLVDICHDVPPQHVRIGALRLAAAARYFPPGTVHLAVVDPGVGGPRRPIAIGAGGQCFVGPDNGLLSLAAPRTAPDWQAVELTNRSHWLPAPSNTFHGRDVFAPVAAFLASGGRLEDVGDAIESLHELTLPPPRRSGRTLAGIVLDVDRFGNLITNIREPDLRDGPAAIEVGGLTVLAMARSYDPRYPLVGVVNSEGWLEIAAPGGNAAGLLDVDLDAPVRVKLGPDGRRRRGLPPDPPGP